MSSDGPGLDDGRPKVDLDPDWSLIGRLPELWPRTDSGLEIRGGGAVSVDTETLRHTAGRFVQAKIDLDAIGERLGSLSNMLGLISDRAWEAKTSAWALVTHLLEVRCEAERITFALQEAAAVYELVELDVERRAATFAGDVAKTAALDAQMDSLRETYPDAWSKALGAEWDRAVMWPSELVRQATETGVAIGGEFGDPAATVAGAGAGLFTLGTVAGLGLAGSGRLANDARLTGAPGPVTLTTVPPAPASGAPASLAGATQRIPGAGESRVRVERYAMPDGTRQFAVYIAGMQTAAIGGDDPWDNKSNIELYTGQQSESYAATERALAEAGALPGDQVHVFGYSQGAMIGAHLALESEYDTRTLVSIGSPVSAEVGAGTLSVTLRHTDDPVAALAGGGHVAAVGAPGSIVVERVADTATGVGDIAVPGHQMTAYAETAALVDASPDPRVDELRGVFDQLASAESVEVTEYSARRTDGVVSPSGGGAG